MQRYTIIEQLETYAITQGWRFEYGVDEFDRNLQLAVEACGAGQNILIADFTATPTIRNSKEISIVYTCFLQLARKFDADGQAAHMDETPMQKYDRRIKELMGALSTAIASVGCANQLDVEANDLIVGINVYDTGVDMAIGNSVVFTDESPTV